MEKTPANIRVMEGHKAYIVAAARLARRQRLGAIWTFFANLFKPLRAPAFAPTRFINRFSAAPSNATLSIPTSGVRAGAGLAFVINTDCANVEEDDGMDPIGAYLPALLLEATDESGWAFLVCGTPIRADECEDPYCRAITLLVNGEAIGVGDTDGLTHSVAALVAQASTPVPLRAGEIIFSGTAAGCASDVAGAELNAGDTVEAEIAGLGVVTAQLS